MKMKRIVSTLLAGVMAMSLVACTGSSAPADTGSAPAEPAKALVQQTVHIEHRLIRAYFSYNVVYRN